MTRHPVDPALLQYFYLPAGAFIVGMASVGFAAALNPSSFWPIVAGLGFGIAVGALLGGRG